VDGLRRASAIGRGLGLVGRKRGWSLVNLKGRHGDTYIQQFGGGTKRCQQQNINRAKELFSEYKARKKAQAAKSKASKTRGNEYGFDTKLQRNSCPTRSR
jgi:hypothetical protein